MSLSDKGKSLMTYSGAKKICYQIEYVKESIRDIKEDFLWLGCGKRLRDGFRDASNCGIDKELCIDCQITLEKINQILDKHFGEKLI